MLRRRSFPHQKLEAYVGKIGGFGEIRGTLVHPAVGGGNKISNCHFGLQFKNKMLSKILAVFK